MEVAALTISMAAVLISLIIAGFAQYSVATFRSEMTGFLGELRGLTGRMADAQDRQFGKMLDAFVAGPEVAERAAQKADESAEGIRQVLSKLESLESRVSGFTDVGSLGKELAAISEALNTTAGTASDAARLAWQARRPQYEVVAQLMFQVHAHRVDLMERFSVDVVALLEEVRSREDAGEHALLSELLRGKPLVYADRAMALTEATGKGVLVYAYDKPTSQQYLAMSEKGRALLEAVERWRSGPTVEGSSPNA